MDGQNLPKWQKSGRVSIDDTRLKEKVVVSWGDHQADNEGDERQFGMFHKSPEPSKENPAGIIPRVLELR